MTTTGLLGTVASRLGLIVLGSGQATTGSVGVSTPVIRSSAADRPSVRAAAVETPTVRATR